jgi:transcriptional regulator with XRE-family HTH domain
MQVTFGPDSAAELLRVVLIRYRDLAGKNQREVATRLGLTQAAISSIENGHTVPIQAHLELMLRFYEQQQHMELLFEVRRIATSEKGKKRAKGAVAIGTASGVELLYGLEYLAHTIETYEPRVVNGLLQTEATIRALMRRHAAYTPGFDPEAETARRLVRQQVLYREPKTADDLKPVDLVFYVEERTLRRIVGSPTITADQVTHLVTASNRPTITIRVIPEAAEENMPAVTGAVTLLTMADDWRMTHAPTFQAAHYYATPDALENAGRLLGQLHHVALDKPQSQALMSTIAKELRTA